ncbi:SDR family oxidoreductase [Vreelandella hamiltonii]|uniref:NAD(P)-dependent oxidoreductase n=1 Tax=Halomonas johnsoniae TaxID=502832 RepID=A0ABQ2WNI0_9GAMM|nr:SDR family oxidoreductase [Halomonas johnsoniae]GGW65573.1 NAD(P)-dependent oxidoreductase [Halomonas johnsoniae]
MIVVTGATGQLGRLVIDALLKRVPAEHIVAAVRNVEKAQPLAELGVHVRQANYDDPDSWQAALQGAEKVLLISSSEIGQRVNQHRAVIEAAKRQGVALLAYTSLLHADSSPLGLAQEHRETEALIHASGVPYVLLRNGWYTENYTQGAPGAVAQGALFGCADEGRIASAGRADYAEAAAIVLASDQHREPVYELAGDSAYTLGELAAVIARQSGQRVDYINVSEADYVSALQQAGLPKEFASLLADADRGVAKGALLDEGRQLSQLLGRPTLTLEEAVKQALSSSR